MRFRVWLLLAAGSAPAFAQQPPALIRETLAPDIYLFRAPVEMDLWTSTNSVVVVNDQDVTVFDSNTRPGTARMVIAEIRKITNKPVRTLINSHWHMDHWTGNDEYRKAFPDVDIIATTETRDYLKRMGPGFFAELAGGGLAASRATLDSAVRTGKLSNGTALTDTARRRMQREIDEAAILAAEMKTVPHVIPNVAFRDTLIFWRGNREFRLYAATGDATGSAVMFLPAEKVLVTGDVLVRPDTGNGPPPWTTTSYSITPWLRSLRSLEALDASIIVPGQGAALHDKSYLTITADLFASLTAQVRHRLELGDVTYDQVLKSVNVDAIGRRYVGGNTPGEDFRTLVAALTRKIYQEAMDGVLRRSPPA